MKISGLKTIAMLVWGGILGVIVLAGFFLYFQKDILFPSPAPVVTQGSRINLISDRTPVPSLTLTPGIIYLPSATARAATPMPVPPTAIPAVLPQVMQYSLTLPADANPLTGQKPAQPDNLDRRPVAVKISSFPRKMVRPVQSGLSRADVVYEYFIGDDYLTRFIAVFYSQDAERAGPVRSGRFFDEYIMRMYHSSLVYGHADDRVENHLLESDLRPLLFEEKDVFFPPLIDSGSNNAENRLFVDTSGVGAKLEDNKRQDLRASVFGALLYPMTMTTINRIYTHYSIYSYNYWEYNPAEQNYLRFSDTADAVGFTQGETYGPHIDNLTGTQLSAENVIVLVVPHIFHNEYDRADLMIDISLTGVGDAYIFREGRMVKARWVRDVVNQPIRMEDEIGRPVPLKPGVTYYQVINPESTISQVDETMEFFFSIPLRKVTLTPTPFGFVPSATPRKSNK